MSAQAQKPRTSKLAIAAFILSIQWIVLLPIAIFADLDFLLIFAFWAPSLSLVLGIASLIMIRRNRGVLAGRGFAIATIVISTCFIILGTIPAFQGWKPPARIICGIHLSGLGKAMLVYANDNNDEYPTADEWCDLLVQYVDVRPKQFICHKSDAKIGESSYALNKNIIGKKASEIPPDVVLLFETNFGKDSAGRRELLGNRGWYKFLDEVGVDWIREYSPAKKVYKRRWNQFGGPELLAGERHKGEGCNILFNDYHVEFVTPERLGELKWKVEETK